MKEKTNVSRTNLLMSFNWTRTDVMSTASARIARASAEHGSLDKRIKTEEEEHKVE